MSEPILCYYKEPWAYFTTQPLDKQTGDDWDDVPYESNAGPPYEPISWGPTREMDYTDDKPNWEIIRVALDGPFECPSSWSSLNSVYSVEMINKRVVPWLQTDCYDTLGSCVQIWAGTTLEEFKRLVKEAGGHVWTEE